jgi:hypothetical protein
MSVLCGFCRKHTQPADVRWRKLSASQALSAPWCGCEAPADEGLSAVAAIGQSVLAARTSS